MAVGGLVSPRGGGLEGRGGGGKVEGKRAGRLGWGWVSQGRVGTAVKERVGSEACVVLSTYYLVPNQVPIPVHRFFSKSGVGEKKSVPYEEFCFFRLPK